MNHEFINATYEPHFSGHESFHLRYGWLKKAYDQVEFTTQTNKLRVFTDDDSIARFGVGKNMVGSIRYWATGCNILKGLNSSIAKTKFGDQIFGAKGLDPYLENANSLWLLHWNLASNIDRTSYYWVFNYFNEPTFTKKILLDKLIHFAEKNDWPSPTINTVEKDLAVLLNTYAMSSQNKMGSEEDSLTSPLAELGLVRKGQRNDEFHLGWGPKPSLGYGTFLFSLLEFWKKHTNANTLSIDSILLDAGSPGRIFLMDENDLAFRLMNIENQTQGKLSWSETAGMRQIVKSSNFDEDELWKHVEADFSSSVRKEL